MFSEVRQAILPIALRNLKRRGDLERAGLLIESLAKSLGRQIALFWLRREAEARLTYAATHDALTGLRNRLSFNAELDRAIQRAKRNSGRLALMFVDLDRFTNDLLPAQPL